MEWEGDLREDKAAKCYITCDTGLRPSSRFLMSLQQPCAGQAWGEREGTPTDLLFPCPHSLSAFLHSDGAGPAAT